MNMAKNDRLKGKKTLKVSNILDEFEKDDIKKRVDLVDLFAFFGVELKKKGKSHTGICPWHNDNDPSLSVDREKGLYNCFGCGESGDIFTLTEKMKGVDFKEALDFLKTWKLPAGKEYRKRLTVASEIKKEEKECKKGDEGDGGDRGDKKECPHPGPLPEGEGGRDSRDGLTLDHVTDYYHKRLYESKEARGYLERRGFVSPELYARFKIGFADGTLVKKAGEKQKKELIEKGVLNEKGPSASPLDSARDKLRTGKEHFLNCLTFPVMDDMGRVTGIYGRRLESMNTKTPTSAGSVQRSGDARSAGDPGGRKSGASGGTRSAGAGMPHLYLKGKHRGVFNRKASRVYDEVILTESFIDALSLIQLGFENVQSLYGTNGFTEEHLAILKDDRVKTVVLAFDSDRPGETAAEKLKEQLLAEGFSMKIIFPPQSPFNKGGSEQSEQGDLKDWNEYLVTGGEKSLIKELIEKAEIFEHEKLEVNFSHEIRQGAYYITIDDVKYRIMGFSRTFTTELKLNVRIYYGEENIFKVLNLYNEKAVSGLVRAVTEVLGLGSAIIESHIDRLILFFEDESERLLGDFDKGPDEIYVLTASEEKEALDILTESDFIREHLLPDTEKIGLVGEIMNKIICYNAIISRMWRRPINVCTLSLYGMGKSFLHDTMHRFVPDEDLKDYSRITKNDLYYREEENAFVGKVLSVDEVEGIADSLYSIRTLISKGYLSISYPSLDPVSGKRKNEENKVFGRPSVFVTGTSDEQLDEETLSRFVVCTTDASNDQRLRIKRRQYYEMMRDGLIERRMEDKIVKKHKNILRMIKKVEVLFPESWKDSLLKVEDGDYSVRNNLCYLSFIASQAIMDQHNRKLYAGDDQYGEFHYVEVTKKDVREANKIMLELFGKSIRDLKPPQRIFFEGVRKYIAGHIKGKNLTATEMPFYEKEVREATKLSPAQVSRYLQDLITLEYITLDGRGKHNKKRYRLEVTDVKDESERYLRGLLDPETL